MLRASGVVWAARATASRASTMRVPSRPRIAVARLMSYRAPGDPEAAPGGSGAVGQYFTAMLGVGGAPVANAWAHTRRLHASLVYSLSMRIVGDIVEIASPVYVMTALRTRGSVLVDASGQSGASLRARRPHPGHLGFWAGDSRYSCILLTCIRSHEHEGSMDKCLMRNC